MATATAERPRPGPASRARHRVPSRLPLCNGDRLGAAEFWRRYSSMPEGFRAELVNGIVFMATPANEEHAGPHGGIASMLGFYAARTVGTRHFTEITTHLRGDNTVEPDAVLVVVPEAGGRSFIRDDHTLGGAPELVVEVAATSASHDLSAKKDAYHASRVREYLVWQTLDHRLDWFVWTARGYARLSADARGVMHSRVFPGLWLEVPALLAERYDAAFDALEAGLRSAEHAAFVARLAAKLKRRRRT